MSLANITRPKSWNEVIGQPTVISILQRQVATKKWKNAYLFCGAHGCGKTTVARIFASAINNGNGFPIEIDGASNNGVDSIRAIINDAQQVSLECDFKVYIIDECHMITSAGWNAALKLIEEPPVGTVFIFCTTNPEKLPGTILSRVQRFDFKKVSSRDIANHLEYLINEYVKCNYEKEALDVIASNADGHVRDAIQMLDMCYDYSNNLTLENVSKVLSVPNASKMTDLIKALYCKQLDNVMSILNTFDSSACSMQKFYDNMLNIVIDYAIAKKLETSNYSNIPQFIYHSLDVPAEFMKAFGTRLMQLRKYVDDSNASVLLKYIFMEICSQ